MKMTRSQSPKACLVSCDRIEETDPAASIPRVRREIELEVPIPPARCAKLNHSSGRRRRDFGAGRAGARSSAHRALLEAPIKCLSPLVIA